MPKQKEDNRDVFDKVFDEAPAVGATSGLILGALAGMRSGAGRKAMRAFKKVERGEKLTSADIALMNRADKRMLPAGLVGGSAGGIAGGYAGSKMSETSKKRRK